MIKRTSAERLALFEDAVDRIILDHDVHSLSPSLTITLNARGPTHDLDEPEFHRLRSFVMDVRPFTLAQDDVYLPKIFADCRKHLTDAVALQAIADAEAGLDQIRKSSGVAVNIGAKEVTPQEAVDLFLYGDLFHPDKEKTERLNKMRPLGRALLRDLFLWYVFKVSEIAYRTATVIGSERANGRMAP